MLAPCAPPLAGMGTCGIDMDDLEEAFEVVVKMLSCGVLLLRCAVDEGLLCREGL